MSFSDEIRSEPGSFRDRTSRVFYQADTVVRTLTAPALADWNQLTRTTFFQRWHNAGKIVQTEQLDPLHFRDLSPEFAASERPSPASPWVAALKHPKLPVVSYPYEWAFGMLKDAALLQLELLRDALAEGMILKDASPYNVQWVGSRPLFIDLPSFTRLCPGEPWVGYRQFCQLFLFPLLLQAYKDLPFHAWLRGSLEGITAQDCHGLMSVRDLLRPGVFSHVYLQAKAQARYADSAQPARPGKPGRQQNLKHELRRAGFHTAVIQANVGRLIKLIRRLSWKRSRSTWAAYTHQLPYTESEQTRKADFVRRVIHSRPWPMVWDLGCNTGTFSRIAAQNATTVVALDVDSLVIERLYQELKADGETTILPLVSNLADPAPNLGWRGTERKALDRRARPDLILGLALIHHLVIGANIPLSDCIAWLAGSGAAVVIEFITREDPMVQTLLRRKDDHHADYETAYFERCLSAAFAIRERQALASGTRILYYGQPKT